VHLAELSQDQSTREAGWDAANAEAAPRAKDTSSELPDVKIFGPFPAGWPACRRTFRNHAEHAGVLGPLFFFLSRVLMASSKEFQ